MSWIMEGIIIGTCRVCLGPYDDEEGHCLNEHCESHQGCGNANCSDTNVTAEDLVFAPEPKGRKEAPK